MLNKSNFIKFIVLCIARYLYFTYLCRQKHIKVIKIQ